MWASVEKSAETVTAQVFEEARRRDPKCRRRWVVLVDGDRHQIARVRAEAKRRGMSKDITLVVDFIHVLEAGTSTTTGASISTPKAAAGRLFAELFAIVGFLSVNILLMVIAFFVYVGAESENRSLLVKALLGKVRVRDLVVQRPQPVDSFTSVYEAGERMIRERRLRTQSWRTTW